MGITLIPCTLSRSQFVIVFAIAFFRHTRVSEQTGKVTPLRGVRRENKGRSSSLLHGVLQCFINIRFNPGFHLVLLGTITIGHSQSFLKIGTDGLSMFAKHFQRAFPRND
jgi:hypothetical protein